MSEQSSGIHGSFKETLPSLFIERELLAKVVEHFPYPIQVFSPDGIARFINKAAMETIGIRSLEAHVGRYNVFEDPLVLKLGAADRVRKVLKGETVYITDFNAPYKDLIRYFNVKDRDIRTISADITCFPILGPGGEIEWFAAVFIIKNVYWGKEEIALGKEYIESHWQEPFNIDKIAKAATLSKSHFVRLFKKNTGVTPHEYYVSYKIGKLKEKLLDSNLPIAQAFAECNMDYNGHTARQFKERVGVSPSEYRKSRK